MCTHEHMAGGVNMYLYECVSLLAPKCAVCVCVCVCVCVRACVCVISEYQQNTKLCVRPQTLVSLSKIAYQMWHDHPFSQKYKATERAVGVRVDRETGGGGGEKNLKGGGGVL